MRIQSLDVAAGPPPYAAAPKPQKNRIRRVCEVGLAIGAIAGVTTGLVFLLKSFSHPQKNGSAPTPWPPPGPALPPVPLAPGQIAHPIAHDLSWKPCPNSSDASAVFVAQPRVTYLLTSPDYETALTLASGNSFAGAGRTHAMSQLFTWSPGNDNGTFFLTPYGATTPIASTRDGMALTKDTKSATAWGLRALANQTWALQDTASSLCLDLGENTALRVLPFKKGLSANGDDWQQSIRTMRPSWVYNWGLAPSGAIPAGIEFVPMVWGFNGDLAELKTNLAFIRAAGAKHVLAFNEPDNAAQANIDVKTAARTWPAFKASGMATISPAAVHDDNNWMKSFTHDVGTQAIGAMAVHWYGGLDPAGLVSNLQEIYDLYQLPIWLTEFCPADWGADARGYPAYGQADVTKFLTEGLPMLDSLPWLERFAYFEPGTGSMVMNNSVLWDSSGKLTDAGRVYQAYPAPLPQA